MPDLVHMLQQGSTNLWVFIPSAVILGALHGLEPGHSKTMMAAFIVAIRGTVWQAVLLGVSATISHTAIVWAIAVGGLYFGRNLDVETSEPYFQLASAAIILGVALWMTWRTWREQLAERRESRGHSHDRGHGHDHPHLRAHPHDETRRIDTGHGVVELSIFEEGQAPRFRIRALGGHLPHSNETRVITTRADGRTQTFAMIARDGFLEGDADIPEPHTFTARLSIGHGGHSHDFDANYSDDHGHGGEVGHSHEGLDVSSAGYQDAHERAHANDIRRRFANQRVTTGQIIVFGLTGGLIPCPASITVLLLCLQLKQIALGAGLVLCFSIGLAATMVIVGVAAALGMRHAERRWSGLFQTIARRAPYASAALIVLVAVVLGLQAWSAIAAA